MQLHEPLPAVLIRFVLDAALLHARRLDRAARRAIAGTAPLRSHREWLTLSAMTVDHHPAPLWVVDDRPLRELVAAEVRAGSSRELASDIDDIIDTHLVGGKVVERLKI